MIGETGRSAIATLVERKTSKTQLIKVKGRTTKEVVAAVARRLRRIGAVIKSVTWDQAKELTDHAELERLIGALATKGINLNAHPAVLRTIQQRLNGRL